MRAPARSDLRAGLVIWLQRARRVWCLERVGFRVPLRRRVVCARIRSSRFGPVISTHIAQIIDRRGCHDQRTCEYNSHNCSPFPQMGRPWHLSRTSGPIYGACSTTLWRSEHRVVAQPCFANDWGSPPFNPPLVHTLLASNPQRGKRRAAAAGNLKNPFFSPRAWDRLAVNSSITNWFARAASPQMFESRIAVREKATEHCREGFLWKHNNTSLRRHWLMGTAVWA